jgi:hypothetical protein
MDSELHSANDHDELDFSDVEVKYDNLCIVSSISVLISIIFSLAVYSLKKKHQLEVDIFDLKTVTIGDYTVEVHLSQQ